MKSSSRLLLLLLSALLAVLIILNALPFVQRAWTSSGADHTNTTTKATPAPAAAPSPSATAPALAGAITVSGQQWGQSTCYIGAAEGSSRFALADLEDLGINTYHIYAGMSRWERQDDSSAYGFPT